MQQNGPEPQARDSQQKETTQDIAFTPSVGQQLEAERCRAEEYLDLLRRTQADFVNYKRRMSQEQGEERLVAQGSILGQLLPVLDDLERALTTIPPQFANHPWMQGLFLVEKRLTTTLEQMGMQQFGKAGDSFNPHWHEALLTEAQAGVPEGTITRVTRPGYAFRESVIRPAQVVVAAAP